MSTSKNSFTLFAPFTILFSYSSEMFLIISFCGFLEVNGVAFFAVYFIYSGRYYLNLYRYFLLIFVSISVTFLLWLFLSPTSSIFSTSIPRNLHNFLVLYFCFQKTPQG